VSARVFESILHLFRVWI